MSKTNERNVFDFKEAIKGIEEMCELYPFAVRRDGTIVILHNGLIEEIKVCFSDKSIFRKIRRR